MSTESFLDANWTLPANDAVVSATNLEFKSPKENHMSAGSNFQIGPLKAGVINANLEALLVGKDIHQVMALRDDYVKRVWELEHILRPEVVGARTQERGEDRIRYDRELLAQNKVALELLEGRIAAHGAPAPEAA